MAREKQAWNNGIIVNYLLVVAIVLFDMAIAILDFVQPLLFVYIPWTRVAEECKWLYPKFDCNHRREDFSYVSRGQE